MKVREIVMIFFIMFIFFIFAFFESQLLIFS